MSVTPIYHCEHFQQHFTTMLTLKQQLWVRQNTCFLGTAAKLHKVLVSHISYSIISQCIFNSPSRRCYKYSTISIALLCSDTISYWRDSSDLTPGWVYTCPLTVCERLAQFAESPGHLDDVWKNQPSGSSWKGSGNRENQSCIEMAYLSPRENQNDSKSKRVCKRHDIGTLS